MLYLAYFGSFLFIYEDIASAEFSLEGLAALSRRSRD
jgi:hypothetical protein